MDALPFQQLNTYFLWKMDDADTYVFGFDAENAAQEAFNDVVEYSWSGMYVVIVNV